MKINSQIKQWRQTFTDSNRRLWESRQDVFARGAKRMLSRVARGGEKALTALANELKESGVYASSGRKQLEYMVLCRLFKSQTRYKDWDQFLKWLNIPVAK